MNRHGSGWPIARPLAVLMLGVYCATAPASATALPAEVQRVLPATRELGQANLNFWGLAVYKARLWAPADFKVEHFERHAFGLELVYARAFLSRDIVARSLEEMGRTEALSSEQATQWREALAKAIPGVAKGDRLLAVHRPAEGLEFLHNGKPTAIIRDAVFAKRFLAIWLSPGTSEPQVRQDLLTLKPL